MSRLKILQMSAYFEPEKISSTHLAKDLFEVLTKEGFEIEDFVPSPCRGIPKETRTKYKKIKYEEKYDKRYIVHRFSMFPEGRNSLIRAIRYVLVNLIQYYKGSKTKDVDVIFAASTPPTQGLLCGMVKRRLSVPFVYNLQDIFPDSLVNAKMTRKGSVLWKIGRKIEDFTYKSADKIIVISEGFKKNIMEKGVPESKIEVVSNWINLDEVHPIERINNRLVSELNIDPNKFIVLYAGNFGITQGAELVLDVAEQLSSYKDIQFVIFGGGALFEEAVEKAKLLNNVYIHELLPLNRVSEVYSLGDVALITCKKGTGGAGLPSKIWSIMACNTPIIASFDKGSDLAYILSDSGAGITLEPENRELLAKEILNLYNMKKDKKTLYHVASRKYVYAYASKNICVSKYSKILKDIIEESRTDEKNLHFKRG